MGPWLWESDHEALSGQGGDQCEREDFVHLCTVPGNHHPSYIESQRFSVYSAMLQKLTVLVLLLVSRTVHGYRE